MMRLRFVESRESYGAAKVSHGPDKSEEELGDESELSPSYSAGPLDYLKFGSDNKLGPRS